MKVDITVPSPELLPDFKTDGRHIEITFDDYDDQLKRERVQQNVMPFLATCCELEQQQDAKTGQVVLLRGWLDTFFNEEAIRDNLYTARASHSVVVRTGEYL